MYCRQYVAQLPRKIFVCDSRIELLYHRFIEIVSFAVYREHTGCFADTDCLLSRQHPVYIARERCHKVDAFDMILAIEYGAVKVSYAPALRNIEPEKLGKLSRRALGDSVSPSSEIS